MMNDFCSNAFQNIQNEVSQNHCLRQPFLKRIQELREGRTIVSFFISFYSQVPLWLEDADLIEEVLCNLDNSKGITLILDAPGGDGLTAERIIQICRSYSGNDFETIVPARAKSAATMVCLGSDRIIMSPTSELGPIDPQVPFDMGGGPEWVAVHHIIRTYDKLFEEAKSLVDGRIEPYLQQLEKFNAVHVDGLRLAANLAENIAISSLQKGMLNGISDTEIRKQIKPFIDPEVTMSHGRAITADQAEQCGLNVLRIDPTEELWKVVWGLYQRSKYVVSRGESPTKLLDTIKDSYTA